VSAQSWTSVVRALIVDDDKRVLLVADADGSRLPSVEVRGGDDDLSAIRCAIRELAGMETIVLRSIEREEDEQRRVLTLTLLLQPESDVEPGPRASWWQVTDLPTAGLSEDDTELIARQLADVAPPERVAWARRGWLAEASAWIERVVQEDGRTTVGPIEQVSNSCISSILRAATTRGRVYFKATAPSPLFVDEGMVTAHLAGLFPGRVPRPLAVDSDRGWMLLDDFGPVVGWGAEPAVKLAVVSAIGQLHVDASAHGEDLLAIGALDRRSDWLAARIESLAREPEMLGLEEQEAQRFAELCARLVDDSTRLADGLVPSSLVHGDLHLANVAGGGGRYLVFDWTDTSLAHPFLDVLVVMLEKDETVRPALRDAYLAAWADFAPLDELLELWRIAEPLACINQVISYCSIIENIESGSDTQMEVMNAYWARKALDAAEAPA
jgi:hypothetical protein